MILLADIHLREESADTVIRQVIPEAGVAAIKEGSRVIGILGDVLTFRYKIDARIQNELIDALRLVIGAGVRFIIIPGNHDQYEVGGRNALEPLDEMDGVSVYTKPTWDSHGFWIPYRKRSEDIAQALVSLESEAPSRIPRVLYAHLGVRGAYMNDTFADSDGLPTEALNSFMVVLLGHYHRRQQIGHCHYVGAPYQTKADEAGDPKGFAIWNGRQLSYATTDWGKRYHSLTVDSTHGLDLSQVRPGDEVRVSTSAEVDSKAIVDQLQKSGVIHVVTPDVEALEARLEVPENSGLPVYAKAYVDAQETSLDKSRLIDVFKELTSA